MDLIAKIFEKKIKKEAQEAIDKYIETSVINSILPHADGASEHTIAIRANLIVSLADVQIDYLQMLGRSVRKTVRLDASVKELVLDSVVKATRPSLLNASENISVNPFELCITTKLDGLGIRKTIMGAGAQIEAISMRLCVRGNVSGKWCGQEEGNGI